MPQSVAQTGECSVISRHLHNIFKEGELEAEAAGADFTPTLTSARLGYRRPHWPAQPNVLAQAAHHSPFHDGRGAVRVDRETNLRAANIDAAVFDLKAVNPNSVTRVDERTPQDIISSIEQQGQIVSAALARLATLLAAE